MMTMRTKRIQVLAAVGIALLLIVGGISLLLYNSRKASAGGNNELHGKAVFPLLVEPWDGETIVYDVPDVGAPWLIAYHTVDAQPEDNWERMTLTESPYPSSYSVTTTPDTCRSAQEAWYGCDIQTAGYIIFKDPRPGRYTFTIEPGNRPISFSFQFDLEKALNRGLYGDDMLWVYPDGTSRIVNNADDWYSYDEEARNEFLGWTGVVLGLGTLLALAVVEYRRRKRRPAPVVEA